MADEKPNDQTKGEPKHWTPKVVLGTDRVLGTSICHLLLLLYGNLT